MKEAGARARTPDPAAPADKTRAAFEAAREHHLAEAAMYRDAAAQSRGDEAARAGKNTKKAGAFSALAYKLDHRLEQYQGEDWVGSLSDRTVLPSYAFPIANVPSETPDRDLKLDRDLRLALSEFVPGASVVAKGRLWRSVGVWSSPQKVNSV